MQRALLQLLGTAFAAVALGTSGCDRSDPQSPAAPSLTETPAGAEGQKAEEVAAAMWRDLLSDDEAALDRAVEALAAVDRGLLRAAIYHKAEGDAVLVAGERVPFITEFRNFALRFKARAGRLNEPRRAACYSALDALFAGLMRSGESLPGKYAEERFAAYGVLASKRIWTLQELSTLGEHAVPYAPEQTIQQLRVVQRRFPMSTGDGVP